MQNYVKILKIMTPIIPHFALECLHDIGEKSFYNWPQVEKKYLEKDIINLVFQINGKKRGIINCVKEIDEKKLIDDIKNNDLYKKHFEDKKIIRSIYVKNRIINLIVQ